MKSLLILNRVKVENANSIAGLVYGFPAVTHFLGYVHALSREIKEQMGVELGGCGIVSHNHAIQAYKTGGWWGDSVFTLTRNPLLKDGKIASFNEEGKVHLEVSLVIECDFRIGDSTFNDTKKFEELVGKLALKKRLAGGVITDIASVEFVKLPQNEEDIPAFFKHIFRKLLPGFVLESRAEFFKAYLEENPERETLDALLDFYVLKSQAFMSSDGANEKNKIEWNRLPKPAGGWLVPLQVGYKAISPLYKEGEVACARDKSVPFRFVEPVYGLGEWLGLNRIQNPETIFWRYRYDQEAYLCVNQVNY